MSSPSESFSASDRVAQASGILIVVSIIGGGFFSPDAPSHGAPLATVLDFYRDHASGILIGDFLWDIAMMALILFSVSLSRFGNRVVPGQLSAELVRPFSSVTACAFVISQGLGGAAGVIARGGLPAHPVRSLDEASHITGHLATLPLGCLVLAAGLTQTARYGVARWLGWFGVLTGTTLILSTSWLAIGQFWIHNVGVTALLAFLLWTLASSISMLFARRV